MTGRCFTLGDIHKQVFSILKASQFPVLASDVCYDLDNC